MSGILLFIAPNFVLGQLSDDFNGELLIQEYCEDSDGELDIELQKLQAGFIIYYYSECESLNENHCSFSQVMNDWCIDSNTLLEQVCDGNRLSNQEIVCGRGCNASACIS